MINLPFVAGTIAAVLHVISGPDHLAVMVPLAIDTNRKVWRVGLFWSFGHLAGMLIIGMLFLLFGEMIALEKISARSEQLIGVVLIVVGLWTVYGIFQKKYNSSNKKGYQRPYLNDGDAHRIPIKKHQKSIDEPHHGNRHEKQIKKNIWSSFVIGILHGFAGITHFLLLLPVLGFSNLLEGFLYIAGFTTGTVLSMTAYALAIGKVAGYAKKQNNRDIFDMICLLGGLFAAAIGAYWLYISF